MSIPSDDLVLVRHLRLKFFPIAFCLTDKLILDAWIAYEGSEHYHAHGVRGFEPALDASAQLAYICHCHNLKGE